MAATDDYGLMRGDIQESKRLDYQHEFFYHLFHKKLVHSSIPLKSEHVVADVGTGSGIWLREVVASSPISSHAYKAVKIKHTGFDISAHLFPSATDLTPNLDFVVHDITQPFPQYYHGAFDLVSIRLLNWALQTQDLEKAVENVIQILRPGGYLQWLDIDACDGWSKPESSTDSAIMKYVIAERIDRGLTPALLTPLVKIIQSFSISLSDEQLNPISLNSQLMRITNLETMSTHKHPSFTVAERKHKILVSPITRALQSHLARKKEIVTNPNITTVDANELHKEIQEIAAILEVLQKNGDLVLSNWEHNSTLIVARKAIIKQRDEAWMYLRYPSPISEEMDISQH